MRHSRAAPAAVRICGCGAAGGDCEPAIRMIAASEPYEPERQTAVAGDGRADSTPSAKFGLRAGGSRRDSTSASCSGRATRSRGPAMITEYTAATLVLPGCAARVDGLGNLCDVTSGRGGGVRVKGQVADPVELAIFQCAVHSIAEEMGAALRRTALSPNIKERRDYSCAVFDGRGRAIAMGDHMPVHLGSMPMSVQAAIASDQFCAGRHCDPERSVCRRNASARHHDGAAGVS